MTAFCLLLKEAPGGGYTRPLEVRIEEIRVPGGSRWVERPLGGLELRTRWGLTALAVKDAPDAPFRYSPAPEEKLRSGAVLVVLGEERRIGEARADAAGA